MRLGLLGRRWDRLVPCDSILINRTLHLDDHGTDTRPSVLLPLLGRGSAIAAYRPGGDTTVQEGSALRTYSHVARIRPSIVSAEGNSLTTNEGAPGSPVLTREEEDTTDVQDQAAVHSGRGTVLGRLQPANPDCPSTKTLPGFCRVEFGPVTPSPRPCRKIHPSLPYHPRQVRWGLAS